MQKWKFRSDPAKDKTGKQTPRPDPGLPELQPVMMEALWTFPGSPQGPTRRAARIRLEVVLETHVTCAFVRPVGPIELSRRYFQKQVCVTVLIGTRADSSTKGSADVKTRPDLTASRGNPSRRTNSALASEELIAY